MILSEQQLRDSIPNITSLNVVKYLPHLQAYLPLYGIETKLRLVHFLAQAGHESLDFYYYRELASGEAYEGRKDLGNTHAGDGVKYKGRGIFQITGELNYKEVSQFIFKDDRLLKNPELLELPINSVQAACWFWTKKRLNKLADKDDVVAISKVINGGTNGLQDRKKRVLTAKKAFGL